ncbi:MAG: hypothetical protein MUF83_04910 [Acidimicrobiales bacterium]|nr:hypothetical protein [Acidimicrobiales bacterium]
MIRTRLVLVAALGVAVLCGAGCSGDDGTTGDAPAATTAVVAVDADAFRSQAEAICVEVGDEIRTASPAAGATPEQASTAFLTIAAANRAGVDRLRALTAPPDLDTDYRAWLELMDQTANDLEAAALALQVGDDRAFQDAVTEAEATSQQAGTAAARLQLPACVFTG